MHDIDGTGLSYGQMVRRVERLGSEVYPRPSEPGDVSAITGDAWRILSEPKRFRASDGQRVSTAQRIAIILDQPKIILTAEFQDGSQIERIAERVGNHHRLGLADRVRGSKLFDPYIAC